MHGLDSASKADGDALQCGHVLTNLFKKLPPINMPLSVRRDWLAQKSTVLQGHGQRTMFQTDVPQYYNGYCSIRLSSILRVSGQFICRFGCDQRLLRQSILCALAVTKFNAQSETGLRWYRQEALNTAAI
jgi:hypothetical protein